MKRHAYVSQISGRKPGHSRVHTDGSLTESYKDPTQNASQRPRKSLLSRPSPDNGHPQRDSRKNRTPGRNAVPQFSFAGRGDNAISKYAEALADSSRRSFTNPLAGVDPVLAAAAAAAVMNAGLIPQAGAGGLSNFSSGGNSSNSAAAVAAVAAAAMNAAAMAAALGVGNTSSSKQASQPRKPSNTPRLSNRRSAESSNASGARTKRFANSRNSRDLHSISERERDASPNQGRFPHHLDHRNPEDDPTATRTLFVGNLMPEITEEDLRSLFERYGFIEDIDIKRRDPGSGINAYAFIRYVNLDMAHRAKVDMSGQLIGQFTCKIGYGKVVPTRCLWIGGLGPWITYPEFANLLEEFGPTEKIIWPSGKNYAHVLFHSVELAVTAADALRGYPLGGVARRIRVDFTDEAHMIRDPLKRRRLNDSASLIDVGPLGHRGQFHSRTDREDDPRPVERSRGKREYTADSDEVRDKSALFSSLVKADSLKKTVRSSRDLLVAKRRARVTTPDEDSERPISSKAPRSPRHSHLDRLTLPSKPLSPQTATNIEQLASCLQTAWDGVFFLKSSSFPCRMHILRGDKSLVDQFMSSRAQSFSKKDSSLSHSGNSTTIFHGMSGSAAGGNEKSAHEPGASVCLRITQRMKLDPVKLEDVNQRINTAGNSGFCVLLAVPSPGSTPTDPTDKQPQRPLRNLISYLRTKDSAGVVLLNPLCVGPGSNDPQSVTGVLHAFPPCDFAFELLKERAVCLQKEYTRDDHLVVLLIRSTGTM
ncbi:RNA-binding protein spenito [Clonorchis sinensis]|uniref:RNA-binding protein spenito n=2 Tax=Clonorchis sinensis TaxID=79923 RepID=A0A8T1MNK3_CLOSI|nr:RNA-binding protein spenito [Clonorchis sinensis]GAA49350.1 RNA-binding protein 15 [Clonorchis sinensis]